MKQTVFRQSLTRGVLLSAVYLLSHAAPGIIIPAAAQEQTSATSVLRPENLVAWCIVPFDAAKRGPAERAAMLKELGITRCAYDWRDEHVATFEQEILEYQKQGIEYFAFWSVHEEAMRLFEKYDMHPQIWQMLHEPSGADQTTKIQSAVDQILSLAKRTRSMGCKLGLYNHGGWGGEPENMVAVCHRLHAMGYEHVGIVYNFHHGHGHIADWAKSLRLMKPYLLCLNLNGMNDREQPKILGIGKGAHELQMIREVIQSGYAGPIGILDHRPDLDARESLLENRDGLRQIRNVIENHNSGQQEIDQRGKLNDTEAKADDGTSDAVPERSQSQRSPLSVKDSERVSRIVADARERGDLTRGAAVFGDAKLACLSCHAIGELGGSVGPELTNLAKDRTLEQIVTSVLWPKFEVQPEYRTWTILTDDGKTLSGYRVASNESQVTLKDPSSGKMTSIAIDEIEAQVEGTTVMPDGLVAAISQQQQLDLIRFMSELGRNGKPLSAELLDALANSQSHRPVGFNHQPGPVDPLRWPNASEIVNRDRVYDFYTKQADFFRKQFHVPQLLTAYPGLDGGQQGHWGNQNEQSWASDRWNQTQLDRVQAGILHAGGQTIPRAVCVRLGDDRELSACFDPDTLTYPAVWKDGFVKFSSVRHGFLHGLLLDGETQAGPDLEMPKQPFQYHGYYRNHQRVVFAYRIGEVEYLDAPWVVDGEFVREFGPLDSHSMREIVLRPNQATDTIESGQLNWPQIVETEITLGVGHPFAIDTIQLPVDNPWQALFYCSGHDFLNDGSAMVCTMQGDVWHVMGLDSKVHAPGIHVDGTNKLTAVGQSTARWKRFASGLHHPLGLVVADDGIYVQCRDQLTRLNDINGDGEADFYECFSNAFETSAAGHDFICGLQRGADGSFYTASGNQGLLKLSPDGKQVTVIATGFRNPDGLGILGDGSLTVPCSEGNWTPASMVCLVSNPSRTDGPNGGSDGDHGAAPQHFGYGGPIGDQPPELPLVYLPRGLDNSSGGQTVVPHDCWGPLSDQLLHFSFGTGTWYIVLRDRVENQSQGAVIPMAGDFRSGIHRGRFSPQDKQLYVSGMQGWGTYTPDDGCFQRVRYTGMPYQIATDFHVHQNGIRITFAQAVDPEMLADIDNHFAQCWNYRYSGAYGSAEYSASHPSVQGHDWLRIAGVHRLPDGHSVFVEIPDLQPVNQLHLRLHVNDEHRYASCNPVGSGHDLFVTVHRLDDPFTDFPGYRDHLKPIATHPLLADMALNTVREPNPWLKKIRDARPIELVTGKNLTYQTREIHSVAGEVIELTLINPDVVPHNWVLVRPGALQSVGEMSNRLIAEPTAFVRHYIPETDQVLSYTDIVGPGERQTIFFRAPAEPGRYPFLCTFPGHWMVMNGEWIVSAQ